jgi:hypothetical protein
MVPVIERAGVFDWVCDEVAVDQRRPGNRAMQVRRGHDGERQHSNHSPNRYADPENPPFPQDIEYIGQLTSCVKAANGLYGTLFVFCPILEVFSRRAPAAVRVSCRRDRGVVNALALAARARVCGPFPSRT